MTKSLKVRKKARQKSTSTDINLLVAPDSREEYVEWDRSKIADQLVLEANLNERVARSVAKAVEKRVLASHITQISTSLIRELVDNELFERGFQKKLHKQNTIGIPKHDVEELVFSKSQENSNIISNNPEAVGFTIAETIMKQYALQEVFSADVADAHYNGAVHLHDLGQPARVYAFNANTKLYVKSGDDVKEMTMGELYDLVIDEPTTQMNETQRVKNCERLGLFVLDRNKWVKLNRVIYSDEVKSMVEFTLSDGSIVSVTNDHGCVVRRNGELLIIRADEVEYTDEFVNVAEESYCGDMSDMQEGV
jgi:hypothetical protein